MKDFEKLQSVLRRVLGSDRSSFYREFYNGHAGAAPLPSTLDEWEALPLLSKQDILKKPYYERLFIPIEDIDLIRVTSGTTGSGFLCFPRSETWTVPELNALGRPRLTLAFFNPFRLASEAYRGDRSTMRCIGGDPARLAATAALAAKAGVDCISGAPGFVLAFVPFLSPVYDLSNIEQLELSSDRCTPMQYEALKRFFPNARIIFIYTSAEMRTAAVSILGADPGHPSAVFSLPYFYFELVDRQGRAIREVEERGEIVVTTLHEGEAFPLIRYRTGDEGVFHSRRGLRSVFTVLGRMSGDYIRVTGGEIRLEEIERAVERIGVAGLIDFTAEIREEDHVGSPVPHLSITLFVEKALTADLLQLAATLASRIKVNSERTYVDGVERGLYAPLSLHMTSFANLQGEFKRRRLIDARG